jgi:hypothetical protein
LKKAIKNKNRAIPAIVFILNTLEAVISFRNEKEESSLRVSNSSLLINSLNDLRNTGIIISVKKNNDETTIAPILFMALATVPFCFSSVIMSRAFHIDPKKLKEEIINIIL